MPTLTPLVTNVSPANFTPGLISLFSEFILRFADGGTHTLQGVPTLFPLLDVLTPAQPLVAGKILQTTKLNSAPFIVLERVIAASAGTTAVIVAYDINGVMTAGRVNVDTPTAPPFGDGMLLTGETSGATATINAGGVIFTGVTLPFVSFDSPTTTPGFPCYSEVVPGKFNPTRIAEERCVGALEVSTTGGIAQLAGILAEKPEVIHAELLASMIKGLFESDWARALLGPKGVVNIQCSSPVVFNRRLEIETRRMILRFDFWKDDAFGTALQPDI